MDWIGLIDLASERPGEHGCSEGDYGRARKTASE
jgi:hypothetical protein